MRVLNPLTIIFPIGFVLLQLFFTTYSLVHAAAIGGGFRESLPIDREVSSQTVEISKIVKESYPQHFHALVIGIDTYQDKTGIWHNLETATNDALIMAKLLKADYGFNNVRLLLNANRHEILNALNELSYAAQPNDSVLVYYAGHAQLEKNKKRGYWIPSDAVGDSRTTYLRNALIRDKIKIIADKALHTLVISDAGFADSLWQPYLMNTSGASIENSLDEQQGQSDFANKSAQVLLAGGNKFVDKSFRDSGYSPFTYFLISELESNKKEMLSLNELAKNVLTAITKNTALKPKIGVLQGMGDNMGQFIFKRNSKFGEIANSDINGKKTFFNEGENPLPVANDSKNYQSDTQQDEQLENFVMPSHRL